MAKGFMDCYKKSNEGNWGSPDEWRDAFKVRMGLDEAVAVLGKDSPHVILSVPLGASIDDIKRAYRKMCMQYHPDRPGGGNSDQFKKATAAYVKLGGR